MKNSDTHMKVCVINSSGKLQKELELSWAWKSKPARRVAGRRVGRLRLPVGGNTGLAALPDGMVPLEERMGKRLHRIAGAWLQKP